MPDPKTVPIDEGASKPATSFPTTDQTTVPRATYDRRGAGGGSRGGSKKVRLKGVRTVKEYPIDRDELFELGGVSLLATVSFSIGYANWQRSQDIQRDLELSQGLPDKLIARWTAKQEDAYDAALIFFAIGLAALIAGGLKLWGVIVTTAHPDAEQKPPLKARLKALWSGTQPPPSTQ